MALKLVTDSTSEPVNLDEAKAHCRVDITDDDALIQALITAARRYVELGSRRALMPQTWRLSINSWPGAGVILIPKMPLASVTSVKYYDGDKTEYILSSATYTVDTDSEPGRVVLDYGQDWPSVATLATNNPIQITFIAGYSDASTVPQMYKQAILLAIGHWYENREAIVTGGGIPKELPMAVDSLMMIDRGYS